MSVSLSLNRGEKGNFKFRNSGMDIKKNHFDITQECLIYKW